MAGLLVFALGWTRDDFSALRSLRAAPFGTSYWHGTGSLVALGPGRVVARVDTLEVVRVDRRSSNSTTHTVLARKLFIYRDPATGEVIEQPGGRGLAILATPCQEVAADWREADGALRVRARATAGQPPLVATAFDGGVRRGAHGRRLELSVALPIVQSARAARADSPVGLRVRAPLGLTFAMGGGGGGSGGPAGGGSGARVREVERYCYWRQPWSRQVRRSYTRVGDGPAWSVPGPHLLQLRSARCRAAWALPRSLRALLREELLTWWRAPASLEAEET
jgi:hypothetical protein